MPGARLPPKKLGLMISYYYFFGLGIGFTGMQKLFEKKSFGGVGNVLDVQSRETKNRVVKFEF